VSDTGIDGKSGTKNARTKETTESMEQTVIETDEKPHISPPKASDDMYYYLRWNPTGDYDSDDDWWNEVMALEQNGHRNEKKKGKRAEAAAARVLEEALYQRYKYHTGKVMKWGNALWTDRYGEQNIDGDGDGDGDGEEHHLSLRTVIGRLNYLALDGIAMPAVIYRNLEHAVDLREEFQTRYVSERKSQGEIGRVRNARRRKRGVAKSPISIPPSPRNSSGETSDDDGIDVDKRFPETPKKSKNDSKTLVTTKGYKHQRIKHQWILNQLKALLTRFETEPSVKFFNSDNKDDIDCSSALRTKASSDSESNRDERNCRTLPEPRATETHPVDDKIGRGGRGENCDESDDKNLSASRTADKYPFDGSSDRSDRDETCEMDGIATTTLSPCLSSASASAPSPVGVEDHCNDLHSTSESTAVDWDQLFGDDGSYVGIHQTSDHSPDPSDLEITISVLLEPPQDEARSMLNPVKLSSDNHFGNHRVDTRLKIETTQKSMPLEHTIAKHDAVEVGNLPNNSVRRDILCRNRNESSTDDTKTKLPHRPKPRPQIIIHQTNGTEILERPSASNIVSQTTPVETNPEQLPQPKQYGSVWDMSLLEGEEVAMLANADGIRTQKDGISMQNSNPPEDWEMLFEEEEEDTLIEDAHRGVAKSLVASATEEDADFASDAMNPPNVSGVRKTNVFPQEKSGTEKSGAEKKHLNESIPQDGSDQVSAKLTKPAYIVTDHLRYESVWDIFAKERTTSGVQVTDKNPISVSANGIDTAGQPEDDWEALYS